VHLYDDAVEGLVPVSVSEESKTLLGEPPTLDEGIAWEAFQQGELRRSGDLQNAETYNESTLFGSELVMPLGEYGVFIASATESDAFGQRDVMLAEILANNAESAMNQLQTEQKLREQEQRLKRTTEFLEQTASVARLGGWEADPRTEALEWTDEVYRIHGFEVGETPSLQEAFAVYHPEDRDRVEAAWDALSSDGEPFDIQARLIRADEVTRWVRIVGIPEYDDEGERVVRAHGIFQDITDQNEREQTLRQYRQAIEASEDLIITVGTDGRYVFANSTYKEYYGCEDVVDRLVSEIIGRDTFEQTVQQHQQTALAGDSVTYERTEELPALGQRTLSVRYAPIRDDEDVLGFVGILRDITEKKAYERQLETQRNNLEILNTIVRHDIRNDIQLIQTYAGILETRAADDTQEYVDEILKAAQSAIEITQSAREITDVMLQSDVELSAMNLRTELDEEIQRLQSSYERAIVDVKGPLDAVEVVADEMLPSVFRNILNNAVQHNDKDIPEITVSTNLTDTTAVVHIADNGPGIPDDQKAAVFEEEHIGLDSNGTGLGLYLVETLVSRYGGQVRVLDNKPEGAIFVLQLPRAES
jgi:PAS domain S-box-containing protein